MDDNSIFIYMDTCIISRIADQNIEPKEAKALRELGDLDNVRLLTSKKLTEEIQKAPYETTRELLLFVAGQFGKVPYIEITIPTHWPWGSPPWGQLPWGTGRWGRGQVDSVYDGLRKLFEPDDTDHIFQATKNNCDYFMTLDDRTILKRVKAHKDELSLLCPKLKFGTPSEILGMILEHE